MKMKISDQLGNKLSIVNLISVQQHFISPEKNQIILQGLK